FDPTGSLTREQMATVLYRYAQYKGADVSASGDISGFADSANVSSWAVDAVKWAVGSGLVNGVEGNALAPQGTSTRAQAATVLMRFVG
ncbi:MAG: S-layer homology domain-containing protein, partial [Clostridiales bacterium]|nr:S-layer homology domain-containing protein [Clostridiales bacterium]